MGTILGSLAAAIVLLSLNYRALGRANLARTIMTRGTVLLVLVVGAASLAPNTPIMALLFMVLQAAVAYFLTEKLQGAAIRYHRQRGGAMHSNLRAAAVGFLAGMAMFFLLVFGVSLFMALTGGLPEPVPPSG